MKTRVLLTAAAMSALALSACNQNQTDDYADTTEDATAVTDDGGMAGSATGGSSSGGSAAGGAMSADQAGANTSGTTSGGAMSASGENLSTANPGGTTGVQGVPSVEQQKEEARAMLSPGGASSGPTAPRS